MRHLLEDTLQLFSRVVERSHLYERQIVELKTRSDETNKSSENEIGLWITLDAALSRAKADAAWCKRAIAALQRVESPRP